MSEALDWARDEFGDANLGDRRLDYRLVRMARSLAEKPDGLVSRVYTNRAELQAAYDFLSNPTAAPEDVLAATTRATATRCASYEFVYVAIDGTSLTLVDRAKTKPLGSVGSKHLPTRGIKVMDAIAVSPDGTLQGALDLQFWTRSHEKNSGSRYLRRKHRRTEMRYWGQAVDRASEVLTAHAPSVRPWFVMDREADEAALLRQLNNDSALFTIRAAQNRVVECRGKRKKLFSAVRASKSFGTRVVSLNRTPNRSARVAKLEVRATRVLLMLPTYTQNNERVAVDVGVVELREIGRRKNPVHWVLLTSSPVDTFKNVEHVINSYVTRWKIEEFHRTWKAGGCDAESIALRSSSGIRKWATLLAAVAARTERLKQLARTQPDAPATIELTADEIAALIYAKRRIKSSVEEVPDEVPSIRTAVRWIGDLGGYAGRYKNYEPGSITIGRGLAKLITWVDAVRFVNETLKNERKKR